MDNMTSTVFNVTSVLANWTALQASHEPRWTLTAVATLFVCISGVIANGVLIFLFARYRQLQTPFNVFILNLLLANMLSLMVQYPMAIVTNLYDLKWYMGAGACTVFLYFQGYLRAGITVSHALIAANRTWAIIHPLSYRAKHTVPFNVRMCTVMWIVLFLIEIPPPTVDAIYYRRPIEQYGCSLNRKVKSIALWSIANTVVFYVIPLTIVFLAFPIICFNKALRRQHRVSVAAIPLASSSTSAVLPSRRSPSEKENPNVSFTRTEEMAAAAKPVAARLTKRHNKYLLLALLTVSVAVCFMPSNIYYVIISLNPNNAVPWFYQTVGLLALLQSLLDPILFTLAVNNLREALWRLFRPNRPVIASYSMPT